MFGFLKQSNTLEKTKVTINKVQIKISGRILEIYWNQLAKKRSALISINPYRFVTTNISITLKY